MWFDTHAHLSDSQFDSDREDVVRRAFANGVDRIVEIADGPADWEKARALAEKFAGRIWWAAGLHPYVSDQASAQLFQSLGAMAAHPQFVAIGEVGLDYAKCPVPKDQQARAFVSAIELALDVGKPLVVHCRDAYVDLHPILEPYFGCRPDKSVAPGVVHCFSGNAADAARLVEMGFYLGVDGPVTYPNAKALREALASVPAERLVLETDSPYLPPQTSRGQRNEPGYLPGIAVRLAELKGETPERFAAISSQNAERLFRLPSA